MDRTTTFITYFGPSSRLSRSDPLRFTSRGVFCSWFGVLVAEAVVAGFATRPRDVDDAFAVCGVFSTGDTSFDGVDARESLSLPIPLDSGFFGLVAVTEIEFAEFALTHNDQRLIGSSLIRYNTHCKHKHKVYGTKR